MAKPPAKPKKQPNTAVASQGGEKGQVIPQKTVEILNRRLGIDVSSDRPDQVMAVMGSITRSRSVSPYTSAEMLQEYRERGFPELVDKVVETIDKENAHRQYLELFVVKKEQGRLDRAQTGAQVVSVLGIIGSLFAGYLGVPISICIVTAAVSIGGPPVATIVARVFDRFYRQK